MKSFPAILSGKRKTYFGFLIANGIAQAAVAVATALMVKTGFDQLVINPEPVPLDQLLRFVLALGTTLAIGTWLTWRGQIDAEKLGQSYVHSVRMRLFKHVARIGSEGVRQMSRGALMLRFVGDLSALRNWVSLGLSRLVISGLTSMLSILALAVVEPVIALAVGVAAVTAIALALLIGPKLRVSTRDVRKNRGRLAAMLNDRVTRIGVVEAFGQERRERRRFSKLSQKLRRSLISRAHTVGLLRALSEASAGIASLCALVVGGVQVSAGMASPGAVVAAMAVAGLLAPRLRDLGRVYEYWNVALVAKQKQIQLLHLKPLGRPKSPPRDKSLSDGPGALQLQNVSRDGQLKGINLSIQAAERVCVVGLNGAGKSTLLRTVAGILQPDQGIVALDNEDIHQHSWAEVRSEFAMVSPDLPLLRGTLRLNLTYGSTSISAEFLHKIVASCGLESLIKRLGKGLDSRIAENGEGLSTGERARIALARALIVRPRVLLLDEAEANLDGVAAQALARIKMEFNGTIIFTTHAHEIAEAADRIVHLEDGCIVHQGSPELLLHPGSATSRLFQPRLRVVKAQ